jgi:hypothetical protein
MEGDIFEFLFGILELVGNVNLNTNNTTSLKMPFSFVEVSFFIFQLLTMGYIGAFVLWSLDGCKKKFSDYLIFKKYGFQPYLYGWTTATISALYICFMVKLSIQF